MNDPFRKKYRALSPDEQEMLDQVKDRASHLNELLQARENIPAEYGRHMALARTNLEQAVMWAVKAITG